MGENTKIEWAHHTFNPWYGCQKVGPGCDHCYAEGWAKRSGLVTWGPGAERRRSSSINWRDPLKWDTAARSMGIRQRVFCASLADVFDNAVPSEWRRDLFELIGKTTNLDWLLVTKRIGNAHAMLDQAVEELAHGINNWTDYPWPNVWIGASIVNQEEADRDIPKLLAVPARVRFLSMEPLLGPVDLSRHLWQCCGCPEPGHPGDGWTTPPDPPTCCNCPDPTELHWVVAGGESGPKARPMHPDWPRTLRDQCAAAGVPFLFKQWGEWSPEDAGETPHRDTVGILPSGDCAYMTQGYVPPFDKHERLVANGNVRLDGRTLMDHIGKKRAGRLLDGVQHDGYPEAC